jgi:hypothetical protein
MKRLFLGLVLGFAALPGWAADLVMVEQHGCHWCARWNAEIAEIYPRTDEGKRAPLHRVDLRNLPDDIAFSSRPVFTPTFVLVENGIELGRIEGYAGDEFFWFLLARLLNDHGIKAEPKT